MRKRVIYRKEAAEIVREDYWTNVGAFLILAPIVISGLLFVRRNVAGLLVLVLLRILWNVFLVGICWFEFRAQDGKGEVRDVYTVLGDHVGNVILTMILRDLVILLFSILLIVPGVMKAYSLRMVPYILAERPATRPLDVLQESEDLMRGRRLRLFKLDMSYLGWAALTLITGGIAGIFWSAPCFGQANGLVYTDLQNAAYVEESLAGDGYDEDWEGPDRSPSAGRTPGAEDGRTALRQRSRE